MHQLRGLGGARRNSEGEAERRGVERGEEWEGGLGLMRGELGRHFSSEVSEVLGGEAERRDVETGEEWETVLGFDAGD